MPDPAHTPVLVGVGQFAERIGEAGYAALSPVDVAGRAAAAALADTGVDPTAWAGVVDVVAATRQFDESTPLGQAPLGRCDNVPRGVAARVGLDPARAVYEVSGGQSPQRLVTEMCGEVAEGRARAALVVGSEALSTVLHLADLPEEERPDFTEHVAGSLEDRGFGLEGVATRHQVDHGLVDPASQYALFEHARRAREGWSRAELSAAMGELFAPFTEVAAADPYAAAPVVRSAEDLVTVTEDNRVVVDPYPQRVVARDKVNQGAAVLVTSEAVARELGVPEERWVYLRGHADLREREILDRADLGASPAAVLAVRAALLMADVELDDLATLDLYSCFPVAVWALTDGLGLPEDDPRGLTVTGGLPFFGGPGNNYSLHAIARTVELARAAPGSWGLVGANGGVLSKYSAGVYSTRPGSWTSGRDDQLQAGLDALPGPEIAWRADGPATVESWTVRTSRSGRRSAIVVGRLEDGRRFLATGIEGDDGPDGLPAVLLGEDGPGAPIFARSTGPGNRVALSEERVDELLPVPPVGFLADYDHTGVRRDGHVLEVTIQRPEARNALTPQANAELAGIVDAYLADPDLWVMILTGAGEKAFCAGNDLKYSASGEPTWVPETGFAGLTSRRGLHKPVIAAVNGIALGGGFEIALACTLVVAEEQAELGLPEVKVGLVAAAGGLARLPRMLPPHLARALALTGRRMSAEEAHRWGLVNRVVPTGTALEAARELAAELMVGSPTAVRLSLRLMEEAQAYADPVDAIEAPSTALDHLLVAQDTLEGVMAFALKTEPRWRNR